jgi:hypothetical protein
VRGLALVVVIACGSKQPKIVEHVESDPEWATTYERRAHDGCACKDADCLERVHAELAKVEVDHGGMDDAPPGVQQAHGELDQCWRDGTKDPARDLDYSATQVCGCADTGCLTKWRTDAMHLADKYAATDLDEVAKAAPSGPASVARARKCIADVTISGADFMVIVDKSTDEMCKCQNMGCAQASMKGRVDALAKYLEIDGVDAIQVRLDELQIKYCKCLGEIAGRELAENISPFPAATKIDVTMNCR